MSFELELLRIDQDGTALVIDRIDCRHGLALAKVMAEDILQQRLKNGGSFPATVALVPERDTL